MNSLSSIFTNQTFSDFSELFGEESNLAWLPILAVGALGSLALGYGYSCLKGRAAKMREAKESAFLNDQWTINFYFNPPSSREGFFQQLEQGLGQETNEEYLDIHPTKYNMRWELCLDATKKSSLFSSEEKEELLEKLQRKSSREKRLVLQYLTKSENLALQEALKKETDPKILQLVKRGDWQVLFDTIHDEKEPRKLSYALLAAFCREEINIDDLATAMVFHRAYVNVPKGSCQIIPINSQTVNELEFEVKNLSNDDIRAELLENIKKIPENQRYFIAIQNDSLDEYTHRVVFLTFTPQNTPDFKGFFRKGNDNSEQFGTFSFSLLKLMFPALQPVVHLAPSLETMFFHIYSQFSDFVLLFPDEAPSIHGSNDKTLFAPIHDVLHTGGRQQRSAIQDDVMEIAKDILEKIDPKWRNEYQKVLEKQSQLGFAKPTFPPHSFLSKEAKIAFILDTIIGELVDGFYKVPENMFRGSLFNAYNPKAIQIVQSLAQEKVREENNRQHLYVEFEDIRSYLPVVKLNQN